MEEELFRYKKVMVIDDTYMDRFIAEKIMKKYSFAESVVCNESAREALEYLMVRKNNPGELPQLIFLDIRMPDMDGFQFLEKYMGLPQEIKGNCRIIMLSSSTNPEDHERSMQNPYVSKFLKKPLNEEKLRKTS